MQDVKVKGGRRVLVKFGGNALSGEGDLERFGQDIAASSSPPACGQCWCTAAAPRYRRRWSAAA